MAPQLSIKVDDWKTKIYRPGDIVQGLVTLRCSGSTSIDSIVITFSGVVRIEFQKQNGGGYFRGAGGTYNAFFKDECVLFSIELPLFIGPYTLPAGSHQYPFEFTFPSASITGAPENPEYHALPPTFEQDLLQQFMRGSCQVRYQLNARLMRPGAFKIDPRAEIWLTLLPRAPADSIPVHFFETSANHVRRSSLLQPGRESTSRSFKEKLRDSLADDAPSVAFTIKCSIRNVNSDGGVQADFMLEHDEANSTTPVVPEFRLKAISATLEVYTSCVNRKYHTQVPIVFPTEMALERITTPISTLVSGETVRVFARLPDIPPSFASKFIGRWYMVQFRIKVECSGKVFDSRFEGPVCVLESPSTSRGSVSVNAPDAQSAAWLDGPQNSSSAAVEAPPGYSYSAVRFRNAV